MKYTTLLALSSFIVFQGYAGLEHITNYGVPEPGDYTHYIQTGDLKNRVERGIIHGPLVLGDYFDLKMGLANAEQKYKEMLIARHMAVQEAYLYGLLDNSELEAPDVETSNMKPTTVAESFWLITKYCVSKEGILDRQPVATYLNNLYHQLMSESGLNN